MLPQSVFLAKSTTGGLLLRTNGQDMMRTSRFRGWSVAWTAFTVAVFAWGVGFYGPSVFLQTLHSTRGWPIAEISSAITFQFVFSAAIIVYFPEIHPRFGIASTTIGCASRPACGSFGRGAP